MARNTKQGSKGTSDLASAMSALSAELAAEFVADNGTPDVQLSESERAEFIDVPGMSASTIDGNTAVVSDTGMLVDVTEGGILPAVTASVDAAVVEVLADPITSRSLTVTDTAGRPMVIPVSGLIADEYVGNFAGALREAITWRQGEAANIREFLTGKAERLLVLRVLSGIDPRPGEGETGKSAAWRSFEQDPAYRVGVNAVIASAGVGSSEALDYYIRPIRQDKGALFKVLESHLAGWTAEQVGEMVDAWFAPKTSRNKLTAAQREALAAKSNAETASTMAQTIAKSAEELAADAVSSVVGTHDPLGILATLAERAAAMSRDKLTGADIVPEGTTTPDAWREAKYADAIVQYNALRRFVRDIGDVLGANPKLPTVGIGE